MITIKDLCNIGLEGDMLLFFHNCNLMHQKYE